MASARRPRGRDVVASEELQDGGRALGSTEGVADDLDVFAALEVEVFRGGLVVLSGPTEFI